jgi:PAS domain S-box-containing protein
MATSEDQADDGARSAADLERARAELAELRRSNKAQLALLDQAPDALFAFTPEGRYSYANQALAEAFGCPADEIVGKSLWDFFPKAEADRRFVEISKVIRTGVGTLVEGTVASAQGRYFQTAVRPVLDEQGRVVGAICTARDLTESKRTEEALRQSELAIKASQRVAHLGSWVWHIESNRLEWSEEMFRIFGIEPEGFHGDLAAVVVAAIHPADREAVERSNRAVVERGAPAPLEYRVVWPDGTVRNVYAEAGELLRDAAGRPTVLTGIVQDVTDRRRVEEAVRDAERIQRLALHVGRLGAFEIDLENGHGHWTPEVAEIWGIPDGFDGNIAAYCWEHTHPEDLPLVTETFERGTQSREVFEMEFRLVRGGGELRWIRWLGQVVRAVAGGPLTAVGVNQDITDRKRAEEEKARLEEQLQRAHRMESVGRLAGGVAHDFNNMLGVILGHTELALEQVSTGQPLHEDLEEIRKAATRSAALTRQLLAFARKQTVAPKVLDLNETVTGMLRMLQRLIGENVQLDWQPQEELWPVSVDPSQVDQILANLCVNARDAIEGVGRLTIATRNTTLGESDQAKHPELRPGQFVRLDVTDDGRGMDEETLAHLFEPFFTTKAIGQGTGLGLATVYGIVKQNHGSVRVESERGHGTTFTIYLPRHVGTPGGGQKSVSPSPAARGRETILLVEDEPAVLGLTKRVLGGLGYTVLSASTPLEAIRVAEAHDGEIHLLLTDVIMPEMNGHELAMRLHAIRPGLRRLYMSGYTANVIPDRGASTDGAGFLAKPFSHSALAAKVRAVLEGHADEGTESARS